MKKKIMILLALTIAIMNFSSCVVREEHGDRGYHHEHHHHHHHDDDNVIIVK